MDLTKKNNYNKKIFIKKKHNEYKFQSNKVQKKISSQLKYNR